MNEIKQKLADGVDGMVIARGFSIGKLPVVCLDYQDNIEFWFLHLLQRVEDLERNLEDLRNATHG